MEEALDNEAERLGRDGLDGLDGFTVTLDRPLLELAKELMRPSSLVIVGDFLLRPRFGSTQLGGLARRRHQQRDGSSHFSTSLTTTLHKYTILRISNMNKIFYVCMWLCIWSS